MGENHKNFKTRANFQNCIDALDGKHICVMKPEDSGFQFFNYKQFLPIDKKLQCTTDKTTVAVVDANYGFTVIDVGHYGRSSDSNIFRQSTMHILVN